MYVQKVNYFGSNLLPLIIAKKNGHFLRTSRGPYVCMFRRGRVLNPSAIIDIVVGAGDSQKISIRNDDFLTPCPSSHNFLENILDIVLRRLSHPPVKMKLQRPVRDVDRKKHFVKFSPPAF